MTDSEERIALGNRIREARTYRGFSQEEVAKYLGVPRSSISLIETGSRGVDSLELRGLARLFECSVGELVGTEELPPADQRGIELVARAAALLTPEDRDEVVRFAQFLQSRKRKRGDGGS